jgi:hypothetical protein
VVIHWGAGGLHQEHITPTDGLLQAAQHSTAQMRDMFTTLRLTEHAVPPAA